MDYVLAKLNIPKGDGDWYVYYSFRNPETGIMTRQPKERDGINRLHTKKEKMAKGAEMVAGINADLKSNWSPYRIAEKSIYHGLTLLETFAKFKKIKESASLSTATLTAHKYALKVFAEFLKKNNLSDLPPDRFTKSIAQSYSDFLCTDKELSAKTHNNHRALIGGFFNMLEAHEIIVKSPLKGVSKLKEVESDYHEPFTKKQRELIKEYLEKHNPDLFLICQFIFYCFIRRTELTKLQIKHIDWTNSRLRIPGLAGKNKKRMSVEIPPVFLVEVKKKFFNEDPENYLFGKGLKCCSIKSHPNSYSKAHRLALNDLGIGKMNTLYGHKHTGAIAFINAGGSEQSLMVQMRHRSIEQTRTYLRRLGMIANTEFSLKMTEF